MHDLVIWGSGGHARVVKQLCEQLGYRVLGFLDEREEMKGRMIDNTPVLGNLSNVDKLKERVQVVCGGVGEITLRKRLTLQTLDNGFHPAPALVHPSAHLPQGCQIGIGSIVLEHSVLSTGCRLGQFVIVNAQVFIGHDAIAGDFSTISPGVNIAGNVIIAPESFLGIGAVIRERVKIGTHSVVGGGAFVMDDVPDHVMVAGVPAVIKKSWEEGQQVFERNRIGRNA